MSEAERALRVDLQGEEGARLVVRAEGWRI